MSRRVLVTGAGGFVGSHVVEAILQRTDWYVVALDSLRHNGELDNFLNAIGIRHGVERVNVDRISWLTHDLTVPLSERQRRRVGVIDYIVNVASRSHVDDSIADPYEFVINNVKLMMTVLEMARDLAPRRLIHMSTDEVFGASTVISEAHCPSSPYAASKAAQEDLLRSYARTYGVRATVINSANMFGERQSVLAFIPRVINALVRGTSMPIHFHDGRPGERNYTYVRNVAEKIVDDMLVVETIGDHSSLLRRLMLGGQRRIDNVTLAQMIATTAGLALNIEPVDGNVVRPGYDPTYAELDNDWTPMTSFDDGLKATVDWALKHTH